MNASPADLDKRLNQLKKEVPTRGFKRHPLIVKSINDLAPELQSGEVTALAAREDIQTIIAFPPQIHHGWHYVPKQALLFTQVEAIHLLASIWPDQEPQVTLLKGSDLIYMEATLILLYGHLEIAAQGCEALTRLNVEFNTVAWYQLSPPLRRLLQATKATPGAATDKTQISPSAQQATEKLPLKFSNGLRIYGLLPGEELEDLVFQPGTWKPRLFFFQKPITANTLLLLTTNFLVVIREELGIPHGWIVTYIPRVCIAGIRNNPGSQWDELTIQLKRGNQAAEYKLNLENNASKDLRGMWGQHGYHWEELPQVI
jgi:hypothetical protein